MRLNEITASIPDEVVLVGRFQPFTAGHLKAYETANKKFKKASIALVVRKSGKMDDDNPLTPEQRERLIKKAIPGVKVYRVPNAHWETIMDKVGHEVALAVGRDRASGMEKQGGSRDGSGNFTYFVVPRADEDISATKVRKAIREGDERAFRRLMPRRLWNEFDSLSKIIK